MSKTRLVIGIDFGTSNSGAAYALFDDDNDGQVDIEVIRKWPHGGLKRDASDKVPSEIAYDETAKPYGHGFDMPAGAQPLQWVKLLLEPDHFTGSQKSQHTERVWRTYEQLDRLGKSPVDVISDYLSWLWKRIQSAILKANDDPHIFETSEVTVVLTVPASWSDRAKDGMLKAASRSGIDADGRRLKFRAEPEAAAIFEIKTRARKRQVVAGDCVIICDAGGGTVDVVTYQVRSRDPISLDQIVVSKGDMCGSAFIDSEFECQLRSILGPDFVQLEPDTLAKLRDDFEYKIKRTYNPEEPDKYTVPVTGLADDPNRGIANGFLHIDDAVLQTSFDAIMTQIMTLIDGQKEELAGKGLLGKLKGILLVGGFGGSEYLHVRIRQEYPEDEGVKVWRGDQSWTAVVQGAVACEAFNQRHHHSINTRLSSYNYGITYRKGSARKVQWLVRKGQPLKSGTQSEPFGLRLNDEPWLDEDEYVKIIVSLVKTEDDNVTEDLDTSARPHVEVTCRVPTAIRHSPDTKLVQENPKAWQIPAEVILILDGPVLSVRCRIQDQEVGAVGLSYDLDDDRASRRESVASSLASPRSSVFASPQLRPNTEARDSFLSTNSNPPPSFPLLPASRITSSTASVPPPAQLPPSSLTQVPSKSPSPGREPPKSRRTSTWKSAWDSVRTERTKEKASKPRKESKSERPPPPPAKDGTERMYTEDGRIVKKPKDEENLFPGLF